MTGESEACLLALQPWYLYQSPRTRSYRTCLTPFAHLITLVGRTQFRRINVNLHLSADERNKSEHKAMAPLETTMNETAGPRRNIEETFRSSTFRARFAAIADSVVTTQLNLV